MAVEFTNQMVPTPAYSLVGRNQEILWMCIMNGKAGLILALSVVAGGACSPTANLVSSSDELEGKAGDSRWGVVQYPADSANAWLTEARERDACEIMKQYCYPKNFRIIKRRQIEAGNSILSTRFECAGSLTAAEQEEYWTGRFLKEIAEEDVLLSFHE